MKILPALPLVLTAALMSSAARAEWRPAKGPLMTRWAKDVKPNQALPEYPRPQMERGEWQNLNGLWSYAIVAQGAPLPKKSDGQILVPFPVESALSGVMKPLGPDQHLWYRRTFEVPRRWQGQRVLLHFGAVDWEATVLVNGREVGRHRGGYDGFSFDITDALRRAGEQELMVVVWDPTDRGPQARGKQVLKPGGIMYTATSGIWQTVWLEPVPVDHITSLRITPDVDAGAVKVEVDANTPYLNYTLKIAVSERGRQVAAAEMAAHGPVITLPQSTSLPLPHAKLWSPDSPFLYDLKLTLTRGGKTVDEVKSYFGMRKIALAPDADGTLRLCLNGKALFQFGLLDQGFWPDGLYTAPTDAALRYDIEMTRKLGFNMARKHVKVEPDRWYYWADRLGLLVWQDMPSAHAGDTKTDRIRPGNEAAAQQFETELKALVSGRINHPCIVMWVPFNEGWGQYDTPRLAGWVKQLDPSRLVNNASGWTDRGAGDVMDLHHYPAPEAPKLEALRASVLGEFGGLGLPVRGHTWQGEKNWGYRSFTNSAALTAAYLGLSDKLHPLSG
jgi:beta-galactosidase/beta-glucuronidase